MIHVDDDDDDDDDDDTDSPLVRLWRERALLCWTGGITSWRQVPRSQVWPKSWLLKIQNVDDSMTKPDFLTLQSSIQ